MIIEQASNYMRVNEYPRYDVLYRDEKGAQYPVYTNLLASEKDPSDILLSVAKMFKPDGLFLVPRKKNGNSFKKLEPMTVEVPADYRPVSVTVASEQPLPADRQGSTATAPLSGIAPAGTPLAPNLPIGQAGLAGDFLGALNEYKYSEEKSRRVKAESELEKIKEKYETLKDQHAVLKEENAFKDKEHSLAMKEFQTDQANSLNGFVSSLKEPQTIEALTGLAVAAKELMSKNAQTIEIGDTANPALLQNPLIKDVAEFLSSQDEETQQQYYDLIILAFKGKINAARIIQKYKVGPQAA